MYDVWTIKNHLVNREYWFIPHSPDGDWVCLICKSHISQPSHSRSKEKEKPWVCFKVMDRAGVSLALWSRGCSPLIRLKVNEVTSQDKLWKGYTRSPGTCHPRKRKLRPEGLGGFSEICVTPGWGVHLPGYRSLTLQGGNGLCFLRGWWGLKTTSQEFTPRPNTKQHRMQANRSY